MIPPAFLDKFNDVPGLKQNTKKLFDFIFYIYYYIDNKDVECIEHLYKR